MQTYDEGCCSACKLLLSFHHNNLLLFLHSSKWSSSLSDGGGANVKNIFINIWLGLVIFQLSLFMFYISTSQKIYPRIGSTGVRTESIE
jgi:hypothetical protein